MGEQLGKEQRTEIILLLHFLPESTQYAATPSVHTVQIVLLLTCDPWTL